MSSAAVGRKPEFFGAFGAQVGEVDGDPHFVERVQVLVGRLRHSVLATLRPVARHIREQLCRVFVSQTIVREGLAQGLLLGFIARKRVEELSKHVVAEVVDAGAFARLDFFEDDCFPLCIGEHLVKRAYFLVND